MGNQKSATFENDKKKRPAVFTSATKLTVSQNPTS